MTLTPFEADLIRTELMKYINQHPTRSLCENVQDFAYYNAPSEPAYRDWQEALSEVCK